MFYMKKTNEIMGLIIQVIFGKVPVFPFTNNDLCLFFYYEITMFHIFYRT